MQNLPDHSEILRTFRLLAIALILVLIMGINASAKVTLARPTVDKLNVRHAPHGQILFTLPVDSIVSVKEQQQGWSRIAYLAGDNLSKAKTGWVSADYLKVVADQETKSAPSNTEFSGDSCVWDYKYLSRTCLSLTDANLDCKEAADGESYNSCQIVIDYDLISNSLGKTAIEAEVSCNADIQVRSRSANNAAQKSTSETGQHIIAPGITTMAAMNLAISFKADPAISTVTVTSVNCRVNEAHIR